MAKEKKTTIETFGKGTQTRTVVHRPVGKPVILSPNQVGKIKKSSGV